MKAESDDSILASVIDELTERIRTNQVIDMDAMRTQYPHLIDRIAPLIPTLQLLANGPTSSDGQSSHRPIVSIPINIDSDLDDFRLVRKIGEGGMGIVFEAIQISLNRTVAVKILREHVALNDRSRVRFENEAIAAARLKNPNIVPVYSIGRQGDTLFYSMQLIQGLTLDQLTIQFAELKDQEEGGPKPLESGESGWRAEPHWETLEIARNEYLQRMARIGRDIASALQFAHETGVIHRDIKPSNVMIDLNDQVWVLDFGLAALDDQKTLTQTGEMVGTLRYVSPEQLLGHGERTDRRTDIYSLGATLYELLAFEPPFAELSQSALMHAILSVDPVSVQHKTFWVPSSLVKIVRKSMEKDIRDRYQTCRELVDDLNRFLDGRRVIACEQPLRVKALRSIQARPITSVAVAIILLALMFGGLIAFGWRRELGQAKIRNEMQGELILSKEAELKSSRLLSVVTKMRDRRARHQVGWLYENLRDLETVCSEATSESDRATLRSEAARTLMGNDLRKRQALLESNDVFRCIWSPDGNQLLAGLNLPIDNLGTIYRFSGASLEKREALTFESPSKLGLGSETFDGLRSLLFVNEGKTLICGTRAGLLHFWNTASQEPDKSIRAHSKAILDIQYSNEYRLIATAGDDCYVRFWSMDNLELIQEMEFKSPIFHIAFAGGRIVVASSELLDIAITNGRMVRTDKDQIDSFHFELVHPTSDRRSIIGAKPEGIGVYDIVLKQQIRTLAYANSDLNQHHTTANRISLSAHDKLLFTSDRAGVKIWDFSSGRMEANLSIGGNFAIGLALHQPSDRLAVWGNNRLDLYEVFDTPIYFSSPTRQYELEAIDFDQMGCYTTDFSLVNLIGVDKPIQLQEFQKFSPSMRKDICRSVLVDGFRKLSVSSDAPKVLLWNDSYKFLRLLDQENDSIHQIPFNLEKANALELSEHGELAYIALEKKFDHRDAGSRAMDMVSAVRVDDGEVIWQWCNSGSETSIPATIQKMERSKNSLYLLCEDQTVRVIDTGNGVLQTEIHLPGSLLRCLCLSNLPELFIGTESGELLLYDVEQRRVLKRCRPHDRAVTGLCRLADGTMISSSEDGTILFSKWTAEAIEEVFRTSIDDASIEQLFLNDANDLIAFRCRGDRSIRFLQLKLLRSEFAKLGIDW